MPLGAAHGGIARLRKQRGERRQAKVKKTKLHSDFKKQPMSKLGEKKPNTLHAGVYNAAVHQGLKRAAGAALKTHPAGRKIMDLHEAMSYGKAAGDTKTRK